MKRRLERYSPHQKYQLADGRIVPGASTIAGFGKKCDPLMGWAARLAREGKDWKTERDKSADIGSIAHFMVECHLLGDEPDLVEFTDKEIELAQPSYDKFMSFWQQAKMQVIAVEIQLVSEEYEYGGTLDLVASDEEGRLVQFDWKTSKQVYESHIYQAGGGYHHLWNENRPDNPLDRTCIVRIGKEKKGDFDTYWIPPNKIPLAWNVFRTNAAAMKAHKEFTYK